MNNVVTTKYVASFFVPNTFLCENSFSPKNSTNVLVILLNLLTEPVLTDLDIDSFHILPVFRIFSVVWLKLT